jgi:hypothetical protein
MDMKIAKQRYNEQKYRAKSREIEFPITFEEWCNVWKLSGKWEQRGCRKGQYVMSRKNDIGSYAVDNISIQLHESNAKDGQVGKTLSPDHIQIIKKKMLGNKHGNKKRSQETCEKVRQAKLRYWAERKNKELANG